MKKTLSVLCALCLLLCLFAPCALGEEEVTMATFLQHLSDACENGGDTTAIDADLLALRDPVADAVAAHWKAVFLDPEYKLYLYGTDDPSVLPITGPHAFVVLGYALQDGEMTAELVGRCDAAAAAALAFPDSLLVCSGGATGQNNPEGHTEAGLMKEYLVREHGIAEERICTDESAMTTVENAVNTFRILRQKGIASITIVTSAYHQQWAQALYNALGARIAQAFGDTIRIQGNYCFPIEPSWHAFLKPYRIAVSQLGSILALSDEELALP